MTTLGAGGVSDNETTTFSTTASLFLSTVSLDVRLLLTTTVFSTIEISSNFLLTGNVKSICSLVIGDVIMIGVDSTTNEEGAV